jgi:hypothetical protein
MAGASGMEGNPLMRDPALFDMYMTAVDEVMAEPEIRGALNEFRLTPQNLRGRMVAAAAQIMEAAPHEFAAYEAVRNDVTRDPDKGSLTAPVLAVFEILIDLVSLSSDNTVRVQRLIRNWLLPGGVLLAITGRATTLVWSWTGVLVAAGVILLCAAALLFGGLWLSGRNRPQILREGSNAPASPIVERVRNDLMAALTHDEFVAQARTLLNTARQNQFSQDYAVSSIAGLSEIYDATYQVSTGTAAELEGLLVRLDGASIGVAGPRGSGKSTLIRGYCEYASPLTAAGNLACMVSAPVDYAARDFVLHLFATFCRAVIQRSHGKPVPSPRVPVLARIRNLEPAAQVVFFIGAAIALLHWQAKIYRATGFPASLIFGTGIVVIVLVDLRVAAATARRARRRPEGRRRRDAAAGRKLASRARQHLVRVRYLQTRTSGWSSTVGLSPGSGGFSFNSARAEQPLSYPEIVSEFRKFARTVAAEVHRDGSRVFIGIDELDKIGTPEQAEHFLNEIKGIFGIPRVYFMVSVSDDALNAFERRGLPLRDAFDSSFDEIIEVTSLSYAESRRLLYRRVIGLTEPYVALCHCMSGGLARDLLRAARQVTRAAQTLTSAASHLPSEDEEGTPAFAYQLLRQQQDRGAPVLSTICAAVVTEDLRRKLRAVSRLANVTGSGTTRELQQTLSMAARYLQAGESPLAIVDIFSERAVMNEPDPVMALRLDLAAYAYYCATLQDAFTGELDVTRFIRATTTADPGSFDALAAARQAFSVDPYLAWRSVTEFRQAWNLETRDPADAVR